MTQINPNDLSRRRWSPQVRSSRQEREAAHHSVAMLFARTLGTYAPKSAVSSGCRRKSVGWHGTRTELMEALHDAYLSGVFRRGDGRAASYKDIVAVFCRMFGLPRPRNPYARASRSRLKRGVKAEPFGTRFVAAMREGREKSFFRGFIDVWEGDYGN